MLLFFGGAKQKRLLLLLFALIIIITFITGLITVSAEPDDGLDDSIYNPKTVVMADFLIMTNALRRQYGLNELKAQKELEQSAVAKLNAMETQQYWGHTSPEGTDFSEYVWQFNVHSTKAGENLARCFENNEQAFKGLVASSEHFKVLTTKDFRYLGVASDIDDKGCESIVMHFSN
jgi:uncharacterized protein YkwD